MFTPRFITTEELLALPPPRWLVEPLLMEGTVTALYGEPGLGKTFLALDLALSIAAGRSWHGQPTLTGPVAYISAEGTSGLGARVRAWAARHQVAPPRSPWLYPCAVDLMLPQTTAAFLDQLRAIPRPVLLVVDTKSKCMSGDENGDMETGAFLTNLDRLRHATDTAVLVLGHSPLADPSRPRGHSSYTGSIDTALWLARTTTTGLLRLNCKKQRDAAEFSPMLLQMTPTAYPALTLPNGLVLPGGESLTVSRGEAPRPPPPSRQPDPPPPSPGGEEEVQEEEGGEGVRAKKRALLLAHFAATGSLEGWETLVSRATYYRVKAELDARKMPSVH